MAEKTGIEWTNHTFNIVRGCRKISAGCTNCYAELFAKRNPGTHGTWGANKVRAFSKPGWEKQFLKWDKEAEKAGEIHNVFVNSMWDPFEGRDEGGKEKRDGPREDYLPAIHGLFRVADLCPNLRFQMLTKRPWNAVVWWIDVAAVATATGAVARWPANLQIGASVEDQAAADERVKWLVKLPARVRFLSMEPLLGGVQVPSLDRIQWVIVGGESGSKARPMHPEWVRSIRDQCQSAGVPWFFKQWGEWIPRSHTGRRHDWHAERTPGGDGWRVPVSEGCRWGALSVDGDFAEGATVWNGHDDDGPGAEAYMHRLGKENTGRTLDGKVWDGFPPEPQRAQLFGGGR